MYLFIPVCYEKIIILSPESLQGHRCPFSFTDLKGKIKWSEANGFLETSAHKP